MIRTPPQHQTDHTKAPGSISPAKTLADQIARHEAHDKPKLTFEQWTDIHYPRAQFQPQAFRVRILEILESAWVASRENL